MSKRFWSSLVSAILLVAPGCRMCCPSYDYCGPLDPAESHSECCGLARQGSAFTGYSEGEVIVDEGVEYETAPAAAPPEPMKKQPMHETSASMRPQARPIPVPQRDRATEVVAPQTVQKTSSRRAS